MKFKWHNIWLGPLVFSVVVFVQLDYWEPQAIFGVFILVFGGLWCWRAVKRERGGG